MANERFWEEQRNHEKMMSEEVLRVMEIMDDHGYEFCDHIDFEYAHQFVSVQTKCEGSIVSWIWAVPKRENFKAVLKWFCNNTKFYGVTAHMAYDGEENVARGKYRPIPTFYGGNEVEREYDRYFGW